MTDGIDVIYAGSVWMRCASCETPHCIWVGPVVTRKMVDATGCYSGPCPPRPGVAAPYQQSYFANQSLGDGLSPEEIEDRISDSSQAETHVSVWTRIARFFPRPRCVSGD